MRNTNFKVSIIIPCLNEEDNVAVLYQQIKGVLVNTPVQFLFVDDGSTDKTLNIIEALAQKDADVKYISFSRNFGHQYALKAGIENSEGDCVICMDADLQHPPALLTTMIDKWQEGFDIVYTVRNDSDNVSALKKITAFIFYKIINSISDIEIRKGTADFRLIDKKIVEVLNNNINEYHLFYRGLIPWIGYKQTGIDYTPNKRSSGKSKYSFLKMLKLALDGITSFSIKPLKLAILLGLLLSLFSGLYGLYALGMFVFTDETVKGWTSILLSVLFIGGINMVLLGIIGEYIGKIYIQTKNRPHYIINKSNIH